MYKGTKFFKVIQNFGIFGGDTVNNDGTNGESYYGMCFRDEYMELTHDSPYLVSTVKPGNTPDTNNSQFMITMSQLLWLDYRYEVFGRLSNNSFALADRIQTVAATQGWS
jgi:peptidyl-prolyl isomerase D